jgi:hypothetical protein
MGDGFKVMAHLPKLPRDFGKSEATLDYWVRHALQLSRRVSVLEGALGSVVHEILWKNSPNLDGSYCCKISKPVLDEALVALLKSQARTSCEQR